MYGVSKINIEPSLMMISVQDVEFKGNSLARYLQIFADNGVVVDMISQSAPHGTTIDFSCTARHRRRRQRFDPVCLLSLSAAPV